MGALPGARSSASWSSVQNRASQSGVTFSGTVSPPNALLMCGADSATFNQLLNSYSIEPRINRIDKSMVTQPWIFNGSHPQYIIYIYTENNNLEHFRTFCQGFGRNILDNSRNRENYPVSPIQVDLSCNGVWQRNKAVQRSCSSDPVGHWLDLQFS